MSELMAALETSRMTMFENAGNNRPDAPVTALSKPPVPDSAIDGHTPSLPNSRLVRSGKVRVGILLWALGVPIPLILLFFLIRGCM
jgi:hypothetical protein